MKLNDPFGRVSKRNQQDYQSLRDRLRQEGIRDSATVAVFRANMTSTTVRLVAVICAVSLGLAVIFPHLLVGVLALDALMLLWIASGYARTRMHLKRYAREECNSD